MTTFVVLLRGINVGATRKVPMADFRALCVDVGLERPETYIQSGNALVNAGTDADDVRARLQAALPDRFGFPVEVVVRTAATWAAVMDANPFGDDPDTAPKMLHLCLSHGPVVEDADAALSPRAISGERIRVAAGCLWIDYGPSGVGRSKLTPAAIDKACGATATARNWNSVGRIAEMINARRGRP